MIQHQIINLCVHIYIVFSVCCNFIICIICVDFIFHSIINKKCLHTTEQKQKTNQQKKPTVCCPSRCHHTSTQPTHTHIINICAAVAHTQCCSKQITESICVRVLLCLFECSAQSWLRGWARSGRYVAKSPLRGSDYVRVIICCFFLLQIHTQSV